MSRTLPPTILVLILDHALATSICSVFRRYWYNGIKGTDFDDISSILLKHRPNAIVFDDTITEDTLQGMINNVDETLGATIPKIMVSRTGKRYSDAVIHTLKQPFTPYELISLVKKLLSESKPILQTKTLKYKNLVMDLETYKVTRDNREIHLGPSEFKILQLFMNDPAVVFSRHEIIKHVWGKNHNIDLRTIDVHVNRIRSLIKNPVDQFPLIKTVRSAGYCLNLPGENHN